MQPIRRRTFVGGAAAVAALASAGRAAAKTHTVTMDPAGSKFTPDTITVRRGDTVEWENTTSVLHSVTFDPAKSKVAGNVELPAGVAAFDSGPMRREAKWSHVFETPGVYRYICRYHENMRMVGTVVVK
ncbi:cupredoxin domain-containing protein [Phenylobacterium sp. VNQ135]|uniref:cupredoxin domain-containing protein n=1 Tax=Phenylobacterium sp. VNQ135 TaxID=3400922 RepID=UPI003C0BFB0C